MKNHHISIEYTIPSLGVINTQIFKPCASSCYIFLDKYGYIEKLKTINQLGVIKNTFNGTHHSRWEYVVLQIYLLNLLKKTDFESGLASNITISFKNQKIKISGCELIQIWILLLNSGHLPGTFASERGVLAHIKENHKFYKTFYKGLPETLKSAFIETINNDDIYNMHKFIIAFLLNRHTDYPIKYENTELKIIHILIKCLQLFILEIDNEKLIKYKFYFKRIRQLSYLFLDSYYTVFPINFNMSQFVFNLESHVNDLFTPNSHLNATLHSFDNLLTNDLYNSQESIREFSIHFHNIQCILSSKDLGSLKLIKDMFEKDYKIFRPSIRDFDDDYEVLYLPFNLGDFLPFNNSIADKYFGMDLERQLNNLIGKRNLLTIQKSSNKRLMTIEIVFKTKNYYNHLFTIQKVAKKLISIKHEIIQEEGNFINYFVDLIFRDAFKEIFLFILNKSNMNNDTIFKFGELDHNPNILSISTKKDFENKQNRNLNGSEKYEEYLTEVIAKNHINRNKSLISFSSVYWYDFSNPKIRSHEIDGLIINFKQNKIQLILIEAKNQKNKAKQVAKSQLKETIEDIKFYSTDEIQVQECHNPKGAFSIISISNFH